MTNYLLIDIQQKEEIQIYPDVLFYSTNTNKAYSKKPNHNLLRAQSYGDQTCVVHTKGEGLKDQRLGKTSHQAFTKHSCVKMQLCPCSCCNRTRHRGDVG